MDESNPQRWLGQDNFINVGERKAVSKPETAWQVMILTTKAEPHSVEWNMFMAAAKSKAGGNVVVADRLINCRDSQIGSYMCDVIDWWLKTPDSFRHVLYVILPTTRKAKLWLINYIMMQKLYEKPNLPAHLEFVKKEVGRRVLFRTSMSIYSTGYRYKLRIVFKMIVVLHKWHMEARYRANARYVEAMREYESLATIVD